MTKQEVLHDIDKYLDKVNMSLDTIIERLNQGHYGLSELTKDVLELLRHDIKK